ncbi:hypothetical protein [Alkalimonas mucilaginosa]|uniref:Uncharacterized protein n=1 Tax=Alkalimonas mucilaginosa TaxID=3057676 RepID=A0ABU7JI85_9GAMM|nr:hypothetical protein [Alkalimonas sp. MEB004]MEE2025053.1 hypothetical protein [Alkalimonas sp. MEB004]
MKTVHEAIAERGLEWDGFFEALHWNQAEGYYFANKDYCLSEFVCCQDEYEAVADNLKRGETQIEVTVCQGITDGFGTRETCKNCSYFRPELRDTKHYGLNPDNCRWRVGDSYFVQFKAKEGVQ